MIRPLNLLTIVPWQTYGGVFCARRGRTMGELSMRTAIAMSLILALLTVPASATEPRTIIPVGGGAIWYFNAQTAQYSPVDLTVDLSFGQFGLIQQSIMIADLTPAHEGATFTINETNAAAYGLDWQETVTFAGTKFTQQWFHSSIDVPSQFIVNSFPDANYGLLDFPFALESIDIYIDTFRNGNIPPSSLVINILLHGIIPEPSALALSCCALPLVLLRRRHHTPHPDRK